MKEMLCIGIVSVSSEESLLSDEIALAPVHVGPNMGIVRYWGVCSALQWALNAAPVLLLYIGCAGGLSL